MISGVRADVALKLFGSDFEELVTRSKQLERVLRDVPGCADLSTEQMLGQPILQIAIDQEQIARYGIAARQVLDLVEAAGGKPLGDVVEGQLRFPLAIRLPDSLRESPEALAELQLAAPSGERVPLSRLAKVRVIDGPRLIAREWSQRRIIIQCNVRGRDVGSFVAEAQRKIAESVELPSGCRLEWGGQFQNMQRAQKRLMLVVPLALLLIVGLLYLSFRDAFDTLAAFVSVPFACIGGILALHYREMPLSISAAVGFITLAGVSVLSSMVLITAIRDLQKQGRSLQQAIGHAAVESLRTIIMTALVASVGFVPMAISEGAGAEVQRPLASVVIGGVLTSTLFSLLILPTLYSWRVRRTSAVPSASVAPPIEDLEPVHASA
jgi:cobalt-zinc-cadmium resistance protein CzcA